MIITKRPPSWPPQFWRSVDPGVHRCAVALWAGNGLRGVGWWTKGDCKGSLPLVIEVPQVYGTRSQKGRQSDIVDLAVAAGMCASALASPTYTSSVYMVRPMTWKGQVPKRIHQQRILDSLTPYEISQIPEGGRKDTLDAIGIGLWALGRM